MHRQFRDRQAGKPVAKLAMFEPAHNREDGLLPGLCRRCRGSASSAGDGRGRRRITADPSGGDTSSHAARICTDASFVIEAAGRPAHSAHDCLRNCSRIKEASAEALARVGALALAIALVRLLALALAHAAARALAHTRTRTHGRTCARARTHCSLVCGARDAGRPRLESSEDSRWQRALHQHAVRPGSEAPAVSAAPTAAENDPRGERAR